MNNGIQKTMRDSFLERLYELMAGHDGIFLLSGDFGAPALDKIRGDFKDRFINVGIAEQNLINVATGLALEGCNVFAYALAPFITMRPYEQLRTNLGILSQIKELNVNVIGVGAGVSYDVSGPTHHCIEDLSIMRTLPNIAVASPSDWVTARQLADFCLGHKRPKYLRFDGKPQTALYSEAAPIDFSTGFSELLSGKDVCIVSTGFMTHRALSASEILKKRGIHAGVIDVFMLKPLNERLLADKLSSYKAFVTVEEGVVECGGLDSLTAAVLGKYLICKPMLRLGFKDTYTFELGGRDHIHRLFGIDAEGIAEAFLKFKLETEKDK